MLESKIREIEAEIRKEMKTLSVVLGDIDGKVNDILHFIEFEKYSASEGARLLKQLKSLRQERRDVKDRHSELHSDLSRVKTMSFRERKKENRCYHNRSTIIKDTIGR